MKLSKAARNYIVQLLEDNPQMTKAALIEIMRPHYIPDFEKLREHDLAKLATQIATTVRDRAGSRRVFSIQDANESVFVNVDNSQDVFKIHAVFKKLKKEQRDRDRSIKKVREAGKKLAGMLQIELSFE